MKKRIVAIIMLVMLVTSIFPVNADMISSDFSVSTSYTKTFSEGGGHYVYSPGEKDTGWYVDFNGVSNHGVGCVYVYGTDKPASSVWCYNKSHAYDTTISRPYKKAYETQMVKVIWKMRKDNDQKYRSEGKFEASGTFNSW